MRFNASSKRKLIVAIFTSLLTLVLFISLSQNTLGQGGAYVDNTPPAFMDIEIEEIDEYIYIHVFVRDLNGWNDIYSVNVAVFDERDRVISNVSFKVYPDLQAITPTIQWDEYTGEYLNTVNSSWANVQVDPWVVGENAQVDVGLRITFAYDKFSGNSVRIVCNDMALLECEYQGPFSAEFIPAPEWPNEAIPISLSSAIAAGGAIFMVYRRLKNNQLARAVENSERGN